MQLDKHIPLPPKGYAGGREISEEKKPLYDLVGNMEVGDSFLCPPQYLLPQGTFFMKTRLETKFNIRLSQRKVEGGIRIWRTA